jgi:4-hydroxy-3-polyprenylbenzoate decarboxylase
VEEAKVAYADLREFLAELKKQGELIEVRKEVESGHEIFTILWALNDMDGPAVVFRNVRGYNIPVVSNIFGTMDRFAMICGFPKGKSLREYQALYVDLLKNKKLWAKPSLVKKAPCKEVILTGDKVDLTKFPILKWHPLDGGPYITLPIVITKDDKFGVNAAIYRMMVHDKNTTGIMCNILQDIGIHLGRAMNKNEERMPCAVAIGVDPAIIEAAVAKVPLRESELEFAAAFRGGEPVDVVKCETLDLEVPATAEIVLEGEIMVKERKKEGPFGEFMGYFEEEMELPVFKVHCITHRNNPLYLMTTEGHFHGDGENIRVVSQISSFTESASKIVTGFRNAWLPHTGRGYMAVISIKKRYPGWGKQAVYQVFSIPFVATQVNIVIIVDDDIDPSNMEEVVWALSTRVDPSIDVVMAPLIGGHPLNPPGRSRPYLFGPTQSTDMTFCSKMGIDATLKMEGEQRERPASIPVKPADSMWKIVQEKWTEYGFPKYFKKTSGTSW